MWVCLIFKRERERERRGGVETLDQVVNIYCRRDWAHCILIKNENKIDDVIAFSLLFRVHVHALCAVCCIRPSVCLSVNYGRSAERSWPRDSSGCISGRGALRKLELYTRSLWKAVMALATGTDASFSDRPYKKQAIMNGHLHVVGCS